MSHQLSLRRAERHRRARLNDRVALARLAISGPPKGVTRIRDAIVVLLLLAAACGPATAAPSVRSPIAPVHAHVSRDTAERYANSLARAAWRDLQRLPKEQAIANIRSQLQSFSDMTGCSIAASHRQQFSAAEHRGFIHALYRNVIVAVKCP